MQSLNKLEIRLNFLPQFHKLRFLRLLGRPGMLSAMAALAQGMLLSLKAALRRCPQGAALQPARPLRPPAKQFNGLGVNRCHQPCLTLQNYWAELCFLQAAQPVPRPGALWLQELAAPGGAVGTGAAEGHQPQIPVPSLKPNLLDRGQEWGAAALQAPI